MSSADSRIERLVAFNKKLIYENRLGLQNARAAAERQESIQEKFQQRIESRLQTLQDCREHIEQHSEMIKQNSRDIQQVGLSLEKHESKLESVFEFMDHLQEKFDQQADVQTQCDFISERLDVLEAILHRKERRSPQATL